MCGEELFYRRLHLTTTSTTTITHFNSDSSTDSYNLNSTYPQIAKKKKLVEAGRYD